jgi:hypothetical protein
MVSARPGADYVAPGKNRIEYKGCNSENRTGWHGPSIQSGLTKWYHFLICLRYTGRLQVNEIFGP